MCRPPALKIITNKDHLMDGIKKPKRVSFDLVQKNEEKQAVAQAQAVALVQNNDLIFTQMFVLSELKNKLQTAITRILVLEKELADFKSREKILLLFCEKHTKKNIAAHFHVDVRQTLL